MFQMGRMCHCKSTIKKWDASGNLVWRRRRGLNQSVSSARVDYAIFVDAASSLLHAGGTLVSGEDEGVLYQYSDIDTGNPSVDWKSDRNGNSEQALSALASYETDKILQASDGYYWSIGDLIQRYSTAGLLQASNTFTGPTRLLAGASGGMFVLAGGTIHRYDTSVSVTHTFSVSFGQQFHDLVTVDATHLALVGQLTVGGGPWKKISLLDHTLVETSSYLEAGSAQRAFRICNNGNTAYTFETILTTPQFAKYDLGGVTKAWANTTMQATGSGYSPPTNNTCLMAVDASNNLYCVAEKAASVSKIQKRSPADGSITWETDIGTSKLENMRGLWVNETAGLLVAIGRWYHGSGSTVPSHIVAIDISTGSVVWHDVHGDVTSSVAGLFDAAIDDDGNVYACGADA